MPYTLNPKPETLLCMHQELNTHCHARPPARLAARTLHGRNPHLVNPLKPQSPKPETRNPKPETRNPTRPLSALSLTSGSYHVVRAGLAIWGLGQGFGV